MIRRLLLSVFVLTFCGQLLSYAQDASVPDSLKLKQRTEEQLAPALEQKTFPQFPGELSFQNEFRPTPTYVDTRGWGMQLSNPVLPWGLQGSSVYENYIGLGASRAATVQRDANIGRLSFSAYTSLQSHFYEYNNAIVFVAGGSANYYINDQWSVTAFGRYATTPAVLFSPAIQAMIPASNFGGYATYHIDNFYLSGGVRREFDPYTNSWETYPIVMPQVKVGDVKIGVDVGPMIKNGVQQMNNKRQPPQTPPSPSGKRR